MSLAEHTTDSTRHGDFQALDKWMEIKVDEVVLFLHFVSAPEADTDRVREHVDEDGAFAGRASGTENVATPTAVVPAMNKVEGNSAPEASLDFLVGHVARQHNGGVHRCGRGVGIRGGNRSSSASLVT